MRNLGLDLLRLLAVLFVFGRHLTVPEGAPGFLRVWQTGGWVGVDLFFVLSGFLVSGLLFREYLRHESVNLKRFLIRRGLKIYPPFYVLIALTLVVKIVSDQPPSTRLVVGEVFFLQNYLGGMWNHTWSLAVEEHFYIGLAVLCFWLLRKRKPSGESHAPFRKVPAICLGVAVTCLLLRMASPFLHDFYTHRRYLFGTHLRIDSLCFGVLLSYLWHLGSLKARTAKLPSTVLVVAGLALLSPAFIFPLREHVWVSIFGVIPLYLGSGALLLAFLRKESSGIKLLNLGGALGAASYSIYLWHMPVAIWGWPMAQKLPGMGSYPSYFVFYMVGSLAFGWMMSKVVEWPVLRLRDRFFPSGARQAGCPEGKPAPERPDASLPAGPITAAR